jgi:hypothetical protein
MSNICAPKKYDRKNNSCFNDEQVLELAKAYNRYVTKVRLSPKKTIEIGGADLIPIKNDKAYLLKEIHKRFNDVCHGNEICLTKQAFMSEVITKMHDDILYKSFRPGGPDNSTEWLDTSNIDEVMAQYEEIYPNFKFFGAVPLDCDQLTFCSLFKINFDKQYKDGFRKFGIVFNHDKYGQSGSHWVALYIDIDAGEINYCDSAGAEPIGNIKDVVDEFKKFYKKNYNKDPIYKKNSKSYQKDSSECGVYSMNFIIRRLYGESFDDVIKDSMIFKQINSCRNVYFSNQPSKYEPDPRCDPGQNIL